jgi:hypothetical protein
MSQGNQHVQPSPWHQPRCIYCGRRIRDGRDACSAHDDLPALDPLARDVKVSA